MTSACYLDEKVVVWIGNDLFLLAFKRTPFAETYGRGSFAKEAEHLHAKHELKKKKEEKKIFRLVRQTIF